MSSLRDRYFLGERKELIRWPLRTLPALRYDFRLLGLSCPLLTPEFGERGLGGRVRL